MIPLAVSKAVIGPVAVPEAFNPAPITQAGGYVPLNAIASAVAAQGERGPYADTYSNLHIDAPHGRVVIYVTSLTRGRDMLRAAKSAHPGIDLNRVRLVRAAYPMKRLDQAISRLMAAATPAGAGIRILGAGPAANGSGIQVAIQVTSKAPVSLAAISSRLSAAAGGIPVTATITGPVQA